MTARSSLAGMKRTTLLGAACLTLFSTTAFAQGKAAFEVASIRPVDDGSAVRIGFQATGSQVRVSGMSVKDLLIVAYGVRPQQIAGPDWIGQLRFSITATVPEGVPGSKVPEMIQTLLAERFQLKQHRETKELPVYVLGVSKNGPRLTEAVKDPNATAGAPDTVTVTGGGDNSGANLNLGGGRSFNMADNQLQIRGMTMRDITETFTRLVDRPVVDQTGLTKSYDITLEFTPDEFNAIRVRSAVNAGVQLPPQALRILDNASPDTLSAPLSRFGLTFEARKAPLEVVVIDSASKTPTEN
jgi:uncharacterized protein (TIGR03435 family)